MDCDQMQTLLHPYLDGELDLVTSLQAEEHLRSCPGCTQSYENYRTLRAGLREETLYFSGPATLESRIRASVRQADTSDRPAFTLRRPFHLASWRGWSLAAALVLAAFWCGSLIRVQTVPPRESLLAQSVVDSHVRSLMAMHLEDVVSTNQHTVKPWFAGKLDYSPPVDNLAAQGFPLVGGRLDYLDNRPVAALIYRRQKHLINLFVWPTQTADATRAGAGRAPETVTRQGYHVLHWESAGMTYWAVSDLNPVELSRFAVLIQQAKSLPSPS